jgi:hypothetical protein
MPLMLVMLMLWPGLVPNDVPPNAYPSDPRRCFLGIVMDPEPAPAPPAPLTVVLNGPEAEGEEGFDWDFLEMLFLEDELSLAGGPVRFLSSQLYF